MKRKILRLLKALEVRHQTWHRRREIRRAYSSAPLAVMMGRWVLPLLGLAALFCILYWAWHPPVAFVPPREENVVPELPLVEEDGTNSYGDKPPPAADTAAAAPELSVNTPQRPEDRLVPGFAWKPPEEMRYLLLTNKADRVMHVVHRQNRRWRVLRRYRVAIGANSGPKQRHGDKRTPEGLYFVVGRKEKAELQPKYGPLAFVLDYPNEKDRAAGRSGQGIWIHGTRPDSMPLQTQGCIELSNADILELSRFISVGIGTPVLIVDVPAIRHPERYGRYDEIAGRRQGILDSYAIRQQLFSRVLPQWERAWESQQIKRYAALYDTSEFAAEGDRWGTWRRRKQRTFVSYDSIAVNLEKVLISNFSPSVTTVKFVQSYRSDKFTAHNGKLLQFVRDGRTWKIRTETTIPAEEMPL